ncbi:RTA1-domain-containing protein [Pleomassaria siparia CBS 279.74]|uniref:RTA1-domain-containing protein n=1 Tax=Pleomassaria siparia CBS 279.74 TaxID=1314801 RepID=A0A6G1KRW0_9PLEO|nr:RTA1-domain-containing protein [Pleomassaria siparia CBS 279.74]
MALHGDSGNGIYPYKPNKAVTVAAAILFGISAVYHVYQMIRKRAWFYIAFVIGSLMMTIGYGFRYVSEGSPDSLGLYIAQSLCIILPPSLYAATIYMIYGRIVLFVDSPEASLIRPTLVTKIFVGGDVLAFLMQAAGGSQMAQVATASRGKNIMLFGLFVQLLFFGFFLAIAIVFWMRMRNSPKLHSIPQYGKHHWTKLLFLLLGAAPIIIVRCFFRVIEFSQGHDGYFVNHEAFMYIFDAAPMLVVQIMFHFVNAADVFGTSPGTLSNLADSESNIDLNQRC